MESTNLKSGLTWMCGPRFDLNGRAAPAVLLYLAHPLPGQLVRVVSGTHCDLVLDPGQAVQLNSALTGRIQRTVLTAKE